MKKKLGNNLENHVHVDSIGVGPSMLEIFFQSLFQGVRDLVEFVEFPYSLHRRMVSKIYCKSIEENGF